jgi:hypothetical protein
MGEKAHRLALVRRTQPHAPSWPAVVRTTLRLWLERRNGPGGKRRTLYVVLLACVAVALVAVLVIRPVLTSAAAQSGKPSAVTPSGQDAAVSQADLQAAALARGDAAAWIAQQVSPDAIVACDPAMCTALEGAGLPAGRLLVLQLSTEDPLGSDLVVATAAVRSQFGASLTDVYAPQVVASFGSGATQVDIRAVAPDGAQAFEAGVSAARAARIAAGRQLLSNKRIHVSAAARAVLTAGNADPRLLVLLAALAAQQRLSIMTFGDPSPGAPAIPLRSVELGAPGVAKLLAFVHAQRSPYLPEHALLVSGTGGRLLLSIQFDAPGPLGFANSP